MIKETVSNVNAFVHPLFERFVDLACIRSNTCKLQLLVIGENCSAILTY